MKNLVSMVAFVLDQRFGLGNEFITEKEFCDKVINYANFLKQPLELWMFVPCDEDGNVLDFIEKPLSPSSDDVWDKWSEYRYAKERCLFDGFKYFSIKKKRESYVFTEGYEINLKCFSTMTIEYISKENLQLTQNAQKQLGWI